MTTEVSRMAFSASFRCFSECVDTRYPLTQAIYRCPKCDGLLAVRHDLGALASKSGAEWKALFDSRWNARSAAADYFGRIARDVEELVVGERELVAARRAGVPPGVLTFGPSAPAGAGRC